MSRTCSLVLLAAALTAGFLSAQGARKLDITWTDRGINNYNVGMTAGGVTPGQTPVLIPMPGESAMPKTQADWARFGKSMEGYFQGKLTQALASGSGQVEFLTQQNIKTGGYALDSARQSDVTEFTRQIGQALLSAKTKLQADGVSATVDGVFGSNGGRAAAEVIPELSNNGGNLFDHVTYVDARAEKTKVQSGCLGLDGGCTIINTKGDISTTYDRLSTSHEMSEKLIADHAVAKDIQGDKIRVMQVDVGSDDAHIAPIKDVASKSPIGVKEWTGNGYTKTQSMTRAELLSNARARQVPGSGPAPVSQGGVISGAGFDPNSLGAEGKAGWERNQTIIRNETLGTTSSPRPVATGSAASTGTGAAIATPVLPGGVISGADFDPAKLSPDGRAGWERNQAVIRNETLGPAATPQPLPAATDARGGINFRTGQAYKPVDGLEKELERLRQEAAKTEKPEPKKQ